MSRHASDRIFDLFAARSRELTPASARREARVLYWPAASDPEVSSRCVALLSESEARRAKRFSSESERGRFRQRRAFRRFCAEAALGPNREAARRDFAETEQGRPFLVDAPDLWLSFSSCRLGALGAWSETHGIGVDVEDRTRRVEAVELAREYFSAAEAEAVEGAADGERLRTFHGLWTLKEAALKSIGEGLPYGLDAFEFALEPRARVLRAPRRHGGAGRFEAHLVERADLCAALVVRSPIPGSDEGTIRPHREDATASRDETVAAGAVLPKAGTT